VRAAATGVFVFACAPGNFVGVFLEVRTLLPAIVSLIPTNIVSAGSGGLPALVGHVLVFSHTVLDKLRLSGVVWDDDAALDSVDQLVSFFRLLLVPLIVHADDSARFVDGLSGICSSTAKDK